MKLFQYAVASIVDANTGNGLLHYSNAPDYSALEQRGRLREAVAHFRRAVGLNPNSQVARENVRRTEAKLRKKNGSDIP